MMDEPSAIGLVSPIRAWPSVLGWSCFLGCSWTWVIGLFLPILLVRDYGFWGWVVFAVPNVLGAAAMGFVLWSPESSRKVCERHESACLRFSDITVAYHVFVVGWLFNIDSMIAIAAVMLVMWLVLWRRPEFILPAAVLVTVISLIAFCYFLDAGGWSASVFSASGEPRLSRVDLLLFIPASLTGFLLCPYLDLTFHRARQSLRPQAGKVAFALGFGVVFLVVIIFSLAYASTLSLTEGGISINDTNWINLVVVHMIVQIAFTLSMHVHEVTERRGHAGLHRTFSYMICGGALAWWALNDVSITTYSIRIGEVIYRMFLLCYGLAFPAYVWLCMIPYRHRPTRKYRMLIFTATIVIAMPLGFYYFVAMYSWLILVVLAILGLARVVLELVGKVKTSDKVDL